MSKSSLKEVQVPGAFDKEDINIRWLPVGKLLIKWNAAQRKETVINHAKKIAGAFDPDKFGILFVTMPDEHGNYHLIDGKHRKTAVELMWGGDEKVPCQIIPTKDPARASEIFLGMNQGRRPVTAIDNFRVSVTAGNPDSIAINKVVRSLGYRIESSTADGCISAIGALKTVYLRFGPDVLRDALTLIQATWGMSNSAVAKPIVFAYGMILGNYYTQLNHGRLREVIQKRFSSADKLMGLVKGLRELSGGSLGEGVYRTLIDNYNRGMKAGQLKQ